MPGQIITFYSYKGGTGRTMTLANSAVILARDRGARVLAIDWDLEAPGLHRFFDHGEGGAAPGPGLIELFVRARDLSRQVPDTERDTFAATVWKELLIDDHVIETSVPSLSLMRAGSLDAGYPERVNTFDWEALYTESPWVFRSFADTLAERYDYVLIDSRTGITDSGGICTMLLPERLVVVFTPNRQSLTGVVDLVRRATSYRHRSDDLRPLAVFPLASRVELSEDDLRRQWRDGRLTSDGSSSAGAARADDGAMGYQPTFEGLFRETYDLPACDLEQYFDEVQIQHSPRFAYGEQVAVLDESGHDRLSLARSYTSFTRALVDTRGPWEVHTEKATSPDRAELARPGVVDDIQWTIHGLAGRAHRLRRIELYARVIQGLVIVAAMTLALLLSLSYEYRSYYWGPIAAGAVGIDGMIELYLRTWAPTRARVELVRCVSALNHEVRLFLAGGGRYGQVDAPEALLVERTGEILADMDPVASDLSML